MIRVEQSNPMAIINTHNLIANDPQLSPRYLATQEKAITHFEDMFKLLGDDNMQDFQRREYFAIQFENQRVPFSSNNERSTKHDTHVQANHPEPQKSIGLA